MKTTADRSPESTGRHPGAGQGADRGSPSILWPFLAVLVTCLGAIGWLVSISPMAMASR